MKHLAFLLLFPFVVNAQDFIVKQTGDTINCKITLVNDQNIFYTYKNKRIEKSGFISLSNVKSFEWDGRKAPSKTSKPVTNVLPPVQSYKPSGSQTMMNMGFTFLGFGVSITGLTFVMAGKPNSSIKDIEIMGYVIAGCGIVGTALVIAGIQNINIVSDKVTFNGFGLQYRI